MCGFVQSISTTHVEVGNERTVVPFDYLIMAMGSSYASNIKVVNPTVEYRWKQHQAELISMKNAATILVIGGGVVGCEVAGNAADRLHKAERLREEEGYTCSRQDPIFFPARRVRTSTFTTYLVSLGVEIHLNQRIVEFDDMLQTYTSSSGEVFSAGKVYRCTGPRANTDALKDAQTDSVIQSALDDKGFVKVDDHLRLHGAPNVFAIRRHRRGKDVPHDWTPRRDRKGRTRAHRRIRDRPRRSRRWNNIMRTVQDGRASGVDQTGVIATCTGRSLRC